MKKLLLFGITVLSIGTVLYSCKADNSDALYDSSEKLSVSLTDSIDFTTEDYGRTRDVEGFANDSIDCVDKGCVWAGGMGGTCVCSGDIEP